MPELVNVGNVLAAAAAGGVRLDVDPQVVALVAEHGQELGSNANGGWARTGGGLQIAWIPQATLTRQTNDFMRATWAFPIAFDAPPTVVFQLREVNSTPNLTYVTLNRLGLLTASSAELVIYRMLGQTGFAAGDTATASALAIGRWK